MSFHTADWQNGSLPLTEGNVGWSFPGVMVPRNFIAGPGGILGFPLCMASYRLPRRGDQPGAGLRRRKRFPTLWPRGTVGFGFLLTELLFIERLLCTRHCTKQFPYSSLFSPHNLAPMKQILALFLFYKNLVLGFLNAYPRPYNR